MARITVEDCLDNVDNRFELVLTASHRARQLANGATPHLDWENDKPTVLALREIAKGLVTTQSLEEERRAKAQAEAAEVEGAEDALDAEIRGMFAAAGEVEEEEGETAAAPDSSTGEEQEDET